MTYYHHIATLTAETMDAAMDALCSRAGVTCLWCAAGYAAGVVVGVLL